MNSILRTSILAAALACASLACAQESSNSGVQRRPRADRNERAATGVSDRMQARLGAESSTDDAEKSWMRVIYRQLDFDTDQNASLFFPEDPIDGQDNLFRIIMRLMANGEINAYEYLDGREIFTDEYRVKMADVLDRFHIPYTMAKGSTERNPKYTIDPGDVPTSEVLSYYIIEKWEYDTRGNRLRSTVEAICPVLHRSGDFGGEAVKYPIFWVKLSDLRPYLAQQMIFVNDDNNLPTCSYDDYFNLAMYKGDIYKTRNLRNRSMMQLYPDPDDLKRAQDSIQTRLDRFEDKLWVPNREDIIAARAAREDAAAGDSVSAAASDDKPAARSARRTSSRSDKKSTRAKEPKVKESKPKTVKADNSSSAARSVRRKKR